MKRLLIIATLITFSLGLAASAQAAPITLGSTANTIFDMAGVLQVKNSGKINAYLGQSAEKFDVFMLGKEADANNILGTNKNGSFQSFGYQWLGGFGSDGWYTPTNAQVGSDILLSDIVIQSTAQGHSATPTHINDASKYNTSALGSPISGPSKVGFQMFEVTADQVTINNNVFWRGTIIIAFEDGWFNHTDYNDMIFALRPKTPAVPIPASALLLAPGLVGIRYLRRKMK